MRFTAISILLAGSGPLYTNTLSERPDFFNARLYFLGDPDEPGTHDHEPVRPRVALTADPAPGPGSTPHPLERQKGTCVAALAGTY